MLAEFEVACAVNAVWNELTYVVDPDLCLDVVSLGLVYDVRAGDDVIVVEMVLRRPGSAAGERLADMVRTAAAGAVAGLAPVDVRVVADPPWDPAMVDEVVAAAAGLRFGSRRPGRDGSGRDRPCHGRSRSGRAPCDRARGDRGHGGLSG